MENTEGKVSAIPPAWDTDIPPVIACATCGLVSCEGCETKASPQPSRDGSLPWETGQSAALPRLIQTSELSATDPQQVFGNLKAGRVGSAFSFALLCELLAVGSFTLVWALLFYSFFPFVAKQMLTSPAVLVTIVLILTGLIAFVVAVHALWGVGLEWGIARAGGAPDMNRGIRFGLYACGWDLLTSPAGLTFEWKRYGFRKGLAHVLAGTKAPRISVNAYLESCRSVSEKERRSAIFTAIALGTAGVFFSGAILFVGLLIAWVPFAL
jgi:hypothetical protein